MGVGPTAIADSPVHDTGNDCAVYTSQFWLDSHAGHHPAMQSYQCTLLCTTLTGKP